MSWKLQIIYPYLFRNVVTIEQELFAHRASRNTSSKYSSDNISNTLNMRAISNNPGGGTPHIKGVGMLVVSLRVVNFGFWCHLGYSGQNAIIFSREGLV